MNTLNYHFPNREREREHNMQSLSRVAHLPVFRSLYLQAHLWANSIGNALGWQSFLLCSCAEYTTLQRKWQRVCLYDSLFPTTLSGLKSPTQWSWDLNHRLSAYSHTHLFPHGAAVLSWKKTFFFKFHIQLCSGCGKYKQFWHAVQATFCVRMEGGSAGSIENS